MIRRIDNLGRVVIPREVRKLLDLNSADEMEISVGENNEVVFKKTNIDFDIKNYAYELGNKLYIALNVPTFIVNNDSILEVFGDKNIKVGDKLTEETKSLLLRKHYTSFNGGQGIKITENSDKFFAEIFMPITKNGYSVGGVIIASNDNNFDLSHLKYLRLAVGIMELIIDEK